MLFMSCMCVMISRLFIAALWSPEGKWLTSWLLFVMLIVILLLSHLVSLDMCGTFLIVSIPDPCSLSYYIYIIRQFGLKCHSSYFFHRCHDVCLWYVDDKNLFGS